MPTATLSVRAASSPESPPTVTPAERKREHRNGHGRRQWPEAVLEVLGRPGSGVRAAGGLTAHDRHGEGEQQGVTANAAV